MTGFLSPGKNPISRMTVRALADLGYVVDPTKADDFRVGTGRRLRGNGHEKISYGNDIHGMPMTQVPTRIKGMKDRFQMRPMNPKFKHEG
jgi:hypothetical protein